MTRSLFTCVIPSLGRATLTGTLDSIRSQPLGMDVEVILVADTHEYRPEVSVAEVAQIFGARYYEFDAGHHDTGSPQLDLGYRAATGLFVLAPGDDDIYVDGAFEMMADIIERQAEPIPLMFKTEMHPNPRRGDMTEPAVLWAEQRIERFNVTGQGFVCPNDPRRMGRWVDDVTFIRETVALHGGRIEWRPELIARCY